jgi:L-seryl-tRNA(Ser) seleniumtransferase
LRGLPSVEQLLQSRQVTETISKYGRALTLKAIQQVLDDLRIKLTTDVKQAMPQREEILIRINSLLSELTTSTLVPVINASGVILHTNLGRAPLSNSALRAMEEVARGYSNLEFNLETGNRGSRLLHAEMLLQQLTGAEEAMVVNNNAAAVLLVLSAFANRKRVIISRSQLVEVGGGFRIPDVMRQSGAKLVEVGTTNRVRIEDYQEALAKPASLVMIVHRSNFKLVGFIEEPEKKEIADLAHENGVILVDDLGSGALLETDYYGLAHEPTIRESLDAGADIVCFSGDKLLGGPQAGIIIGKKDLLEKIKRHPLARAVRADKICLAALNATLLHYLLGEAEQEIPIWRMLSATPDQLKARVDNWIIKINLGMVMENESTVGGGSLPGENMPTWVLSLNVKSPNKFMNALRMEQPPIIARMEHDRVLFDPRTVLPEQDDVLLESISKILHSQKQSRNL